MRRGWRTAGAALVVALAMAGCGGGDDDGDDDAAPAREATGDDTHSGDDDGAGDEDRCELLDADQAGEILGVELADGQGVSDIACTWEHADGSSGLQLFVDDGADAADVYAGNQEGGEVEPVDVGDEAYFRDRNGAADVNALVDGVLVKVTYFYDELTPELRDQLTEIAALAIEALSE